MERLQLSPDNQFNGMLREDFKQMLISMGFKVEDCEGPGRFSFEDENDEELLFEDPKNDMRPYDVAAQYGSMCNSFHFENQGTRFLAAPFAA